jgi:hypothetical protein
MTDSIEQKVDKKLVAERRELRAKRKQALARETREARARKKLTAAEAKAWRAFEKTGEDESSPQYLAWKKASDEDARAGKSLLGLSRMIVTYTEKLKQLDSPREREARVAKERRLAELRDRTRVPRGGHHMASKTNSKSTTSKSASAKRSDKQTEAIRAEVEKALASAKGIGSDAEQATRFGIKVVKHQRGLRGTAAPAKLHNLTEAQAKAIRRALGVSVEAAPVKKTTAKANGKAKAPAKAKASKQVKPDPKKKTTARKRQSKAVAAK